MKLERKPEKLGAILVAHKMAVQKDVDAALAEQKKTKERIGEALVRKGTASLEDVYWALANQYNISYMHVDRDQVDPEIVRIVPEELARRYSILPLLKVANDLIIVVDDPVNTGVFDDVESLTGCDLSITLAKANEIQDALDSVYGQRAEESEGASSINSLSELFPKKDLSKLAADESGATLLDRLLKEVIGGSVELLHIDRIGASTVVRARIAGRLEPWLNVAGDLGGGLSTRVRVLAGISSMDDDDPSGTLHREIDGKNLALDVVILPAANGESIILRPRREAVTIPALKKLGFTKTQLKQVKSLAGLRRGLIVATGPRASGKTTSLYSIFNEADPLKEKLVAIEDEPVGETETSLSMHVDSDDQVYAVLEKALAADPDSILIQPIPDTKVLERAINEALQGIKVGIQLPYGDTSSALSYLLHGPVVPQAVAGALAGVVAQRIVRILCDKCKKKEKPPASLKAKTGARSALPVQTFRPEGCKACGGSGYAGRTAFYEVVIPNADLRVLLGEKPDTASIRRVVEEMKIETLRDRALEMYTDGITSREEIAEFL